MHNIFAIEPAALNNWVEIRYTLEKFGFSKGILVAKLPKTWSSLVLEKCKASNMSDIELAKIVEKLNEVKMDGLVKLGAEYNPDNAWIENAVSPGICDKLTAILSSLPCEHSKVYTLGEAPRDIFEGFRESEIRRTAEAIGDAAKHLIMDAVEVVIVDPYIQPKPANIKVLKALLARCNKLQQLDIHVAFSKYAVDFAHAGREYNRMLKDSIGSEIQLNIIRWEDDSLNFDMHARYVLSDLRGIYRGLRFDRGFDEPADHGKREHLTSVVCMEEKFAEKIMSQYAEYRNAEGSKHPKVVDIITIGRQSK